MDAAHFIYKLVPVRPKFLENLTVEDEMHLQAHFDYLQNLYHKQKLVLAGPCMDAAFGIVILQGMDNQEAEHVMTNDPAIVNGLMTAELHPFRISIGQA